MAEADRTSKDVDVADKESRAKSRDPLVGTVLDGRFQIESVIGSGGMSVVYKATQLRVNRHVAIKTLKLQLDTKDIYRERFQREISSLCTLNHPNIVTVFDCVIGADDQPYIVMDYLRGRSLEALIADEGAMSVERFARISIQICSALEHAHKRGIIHRDLKPGNVVLMDDEMDFVKVVDFGLAKIGDQNKRLTHSGELWGSPPYMSPEQCMGEALDSRSDIYSIGAVMYEMLCGKDPFPNATTVFEFIKFHTSVVPPFMVQANPRCNVPPRVEAVVFKAMEKKAADRYQSAKELQEAIVEASASVVDREKGEFLRHLAQQTSVKTPSGQTPTNYAADDSGPTASEAFRRAVNPLAQTSPENISVVQAESGETGQKTEIEAGSNDLEVAGNRPVDTLKSSSQDSKAPRPVNTLHGPNAPNPSKPYLVILLLVALACLIYLTYPALTGAGRQEQMKDRADNKVLPPQSQVQVAPVVTMPVPEAAALQVHKAAVSAKSDKAPKKSPLRSLLMPAPKLAAPTNHHNHSAAHSSPPPIKAEETSDPWTKLDKMR